MLENKDLTPSEQLTSFLDGELTTGEASDLFYSLAQNPELQEEMRQHIAIKNTFKAALIVPPELLHAKILDKTGLSDDSKFVPFGKFGKTIKLVFSKRSVWISTGILLLALLSWYFAAPGVSGNKPVNNIFAANGSKSKAREYPVVSSNALPDGVSAAVDDPNAQSTNVTRRSNISNKAHKKGDFLVDAGKSSAESIKTTNSGSDADLVTKYPQIDPSQAFNQSKNVKIDPSKRHYYPYQTSTLNNALENLSFNIKLRSTGSSNPDLGLPNAQSSFLDQFEFAFLYAIDSHYSIGFEGGRENYQMEFDKYYGDTLMGISQSYSALWGGVDFRYSLNPIPWLGQSVPYAGLTIGANNVGAIMKAEGGLRYFAFDGIAMIGGVEYGMLFYKNDGNITDFSSNWYISQKFNLFVGFSFGMF